MCPLCAVFALQALQQENAALCFVCIVMAAYISNKVQMEKGSDIEEDGTFYQADFSNTKNNSAARINKMLCLDPLLICDFTFYRCTWRLCILLFCHVSVEEKINIHSPLEQCSVCHFFRELSSCQCDNWFCKRINEILCLDPLLICDFTFVALGGFAFCCSAMCLWRKR
uniref:Uncharacterized protein n=1 Tax=Ditylum brightwellii TaxID=49249 RepID=A0A7S4SB27_9STRA